jgi:lipid-A-disaccharide synthase
MSRASAAPATAHDAALRVFLVAAEESGDRLGAALMRALRRIRPDIRFAGVGGRAMAGEGLASLFPIDDLAIVGLAAIPKRLAGIFRHIRETAAAALAMRPHVCVVIDSPDFTHRVARRLRAAAPAIPIVDYVSPSVWAWRPGRARAMRRYIDHVLALLPFEPRVHERLGGPPCTYVGHPLIDEINELRPSVEDARRREQAPPVLVALAGSRKGEIDWLLDIFLRTIGDLRQRIGPLDVVMPTLPHLAPRLEAAVGGLPLPPRIVTDMREKYAAFRIARAALAKSGTVTLELALAGVPMIATYKASAFEAWVARRLVTVPSIILPNLVLGENVVPELLQEECTPDRLAAALADIMRDGPARGRQLEAFSRLDAIMQIGTAGPAARAAEVVLSVAGVSAERAAAPR